nr:MAG TPA: hypothetical protein [Caudoviricetes sp.]
MLLYYQGRLFDPDNPLVLLLYGSAYIPGLN